MLRHKAIVAGLVLALALTAAPARHGYSMDQVKSLVNRIRPGTFPELDAGKMAKALPQVREAPQREALTDTERQILLNLMERKRQLDERDTLLNQREEQLRALRDNIQQQVAELKRLQASIEASMEAKKTQDAENLQKVVNLYNGMDPKRAAEKLAQLEPKVGTQILMGMNQRKAAQLLAELPVDKAKQITESIVNKVPVARN